MASFIALSALAQGPYGFSFALMRTGTGVVSTACRRTWGRAAATNPIPASLPNERRERASMVASCAVKYTPSDKIAVSMDPTSEGALAAIGNTPLIELRRVVPRGAARVLVKLEWANP